MTKVPKRLVNAFNRLSGERLCRQTSNATDAQERGGGFVYFTAPSNKRIGPAAGYALIKAKVVKPISDGLFEGQSQSFEPISESEFKRLQDGNASL